MIYLLTDFGSNDIYVGQIKASLLRLEPATVIIDLLHNAPDHDVCSAAHLLAALTLSVPDHDAVMLAVVDPGVGGDRRPIVLQADGRWYVGPDNGLLSVVGQRAKNCRVWEITWRPQFMSNSFHGRDLFAPIASMLASGACWDGALREISGMDVELDATDLHRVIYIDHYGSAITGIRQGTLPRHARLAINGTYLSYARVFSEVPLGSFFWYENSIGLVEVAGNSCRAAEQLDLVVGSVLQAVN